MISCSRIRSEIIGEYSRSQGSIRFRTPYESISSHLTLILEHLFIQARRGVNQFVNIPNILTLCRFTLIPVYLIVFFSGHLGFAFGIVVLAGATDVLDGYLARRNKQVTVVGSMLDPLADKSMMIAVILSLLYEQLISWQAAAAIFIRDIGMIIGSAFFHFRGKKTVPANIMGKMTTVLYYLAIMWIFFGWAFADAILWTAIILSFVTSFVYVARFRMINSKS